MAVETSVAPGAPLRDRKRLVEWWIRINYGRMEGLTFRDGRPILDPKPGEVHTIKLGGKNGPRVGISVDELIHHPRVVGFFQQLSVYGNGVVRRVTLQEGIPDMIDIEPKGQA